MRSLKDKIATAAGHVDECRRIVDRQRRRVAADGAGLAELQVSWRYSAVDAAKRRSPNERNGTAELLRITSAAACRNLKVLARQYGAIDTEIAFIDENTMALHRGTRTRAARRLQKPGSCLLAPFWRR
ncbi:hypothetical protein [Bradyrhizobium paxllaeri]|uniref:hypothetical protein n=1 Tax=Bradyrhizobium paxllaeri TaxID=190148 RepID=UPI000810E7FB|nr:hypothetical protein [Bradyrhizobium paxllaeri]